MNLQLVAKLSISSRSPSRDLLMRSRSFSEKYSRQVASARSHQGTMGTVHQEDRTYFPAWPPAQCLCVFCPPPHQSQIHQSFGHPCLLLHCSLVVFVCIAVSVVSIPSCRRPTSNPPGTCGRASPITTMLNIAVGFFMLLLPESKPDSHRDDDVTSFIVPTNFG